MDNRSRVYAAILPELSIEHENEHEQRLGVRTGNPLGPVSRVRELQVSGSAEARCPADRASVRFGVCSSKESVNEVTDSVSRRLDYILQAVRQHGVPDEDASVRRRLRRDAGQYRMDAEAVVTFSDFERMERACGVLLEKLDQRVCVGTPRFYHSDSGLSRVRRRAFVSAVENAQQKAQEVGRLLGQTLGSPLLVREEESKEWRNEEEEEGGGGHGAAPAPRVPGTPTITVFSRVSVSFSLRDGSRKKL
ncbi:interleukin-1 receptor-associated kinase 1-binding protein 1 homolog [Brachionichthys hirsutus]|uniref:interleukin-1 receptor-associated kinase 1-binding protein 1 homolog n=1 Tax=Brachionichthys hirsutus TaxID=412623 RepID=UPI003604AF61